MTDVEPPVIVDGDLVVECDGGDCEEQTEIPVEIDAVDASGDDWTVTFIRTGDGTLGVYESYCPEHRIDAEIEALADESNKLAESVMKTMRATKHIRDNQ